MLEQVEVDGVVQDVIHLNYDTDRFCGSIGN